MKRIGILTSGGDCPGMNAAIRSVVRTCLYEGIVPFGIESGYKGLIEDKITQMTSKDVANTIQRGGTFLRSARSMEFKTEEGQKTALANLEKHGIEGLVVIGGDGSLTGANLLYTKYGVPVVGIPGSIDNDIYGTELSLGVDTALNTIVSSIDMINDTASSHDRTFLIEVMGRNCGYLALMAAVTAGAEAVIIPEIKYSLESIIDKIKRRYQEGKTRSIVLVAEGAGSAYDFGKAFALIGGFDTRITVLGHLQRGGSPTHFDRILGTRMGMYAVKHLQDGKYGVMMGLCNNAIVPMPLEEVLSNKKPLNTELLILADVMS
ncbi:MAG: 6-phosphofructokinase [Deferribacteraceae bacterium]|jgi:6-phosphofructokinase 1|nr:6-phosphofructokinase [Deferribacteraceae bacterium]